MNGIDDVGEDMVVKGVTMKCEKHEVAPPLLVRHRGFQNDRDYRSYVREVSSLHMQVHSEGGIGVGVDVDGVIVVIVLGDCDPLRNGELLFHVTSDGLLLLPSEGDGVLMRPCLV
jgi:hypothetical protein